MRQKKIRQRLRPKLGQDFPPPGLLFGHRVLVAARIQQLEQSGKDVTAYRAKLQDLNNLAATHDTPTLRVSIEKFKAEIGVALPKEQRDP